MALAQNLEEKCVPSLKSHGNCQGNHESICWSGPVWGSLYLWSCLWNSLYRPQLEEAVLLVWRDEGRRSANASLRMHRKDPKFEVVRIGNSYYRLGSLLTTGFIGFELCQFGFMCFRGHGRLLCGFEAMEAWIWEFQRCRHARKVAGSLLSMRTSSSNAKSAAGQVQHAWGWYVSEMPSGASSLAKLVYGNYTYTYNKLVYGTVTIMLKANKVLWWLYL